MKTTTQLHKCRGRDITITLGGGAKITHAQVRNVYYENILKSPCARNLKENQLNF